MPGTSKVTLSMEELVVDSSSRQRSSPCRTSPNRGPKTPSPRKHGSPRSKTPEVTVHTEPSGDIHVTVKVSELKPHKSKCPKGQSSPVSHTSSSYVSPPENITPSQRLLLDALQIQVDRQALNVELKRYINQLMSMSRVSIDRLNEGDSLDPTRNSPERDVNDDIIMLSELSSEYAEQVNTLVDMLDQIEPLRTPPGDCLPQPVPSASPGRSPPPVHNAVTPCTSRIPRPAPTPPAEQRGPSTPCAPGGQSQAGRTPSRGRSTTPSRGPSTERPPWRYSSPASRTPSPAQRIPLKPVSPPMGRRKRPLTPEPTKVVGPPPGSNVSKIPISPRYQPQRPGMDDIQIPFRISANLLPHPDELPPMVPRGQKPITAGYKPAGSPVMESPEFRSPCSPQGTAGFPGTPSSPLRTNLPEPQFTDDFAGQQFTDDFAGQQFTDDFGNQPCNDDFGGQQFGDDFGGDFNADFGADWDNANALLDESAASSGHVTYPEDFPSPTDVYGPGFDWDAANLTDPAWPKSFPGHPSMAQTGVSDSDNIQIDSSFDTNAIQYPVNLEKINQIRAKLSRICNDQYREVIEVLKKDQASDQNQYENLLKRVRSDPFQDPDATLAPIGYSAQGSSRSGTPSSSSPRSNNNTIDNIEAMNILSSSIKNKTASPRCDHSTPITNFEEVD